MAGFVEDPSVKPAPDLPDIEETTKYRLRINGKPFHKLNGKKIKNLIYNGTIYEILETCTVTIIIDSGCTDTVTYEDDNGNFIEINGSVTLTDREKVTIKSDRLICYTKDNPVKDPDSTAKNITFMLGGKDTTIYIFSYNAYTDG